jgi:hypothetical protein
MESGTEGFIDVWIGIPCGSAVWLAVPVRGPIVSVG